MPISSSRYQTSAEYKYQTITFNYLGKEYKRRTDMQGRMDFKGVTGSLLAFKYCGFDPYKVKALPKNCRIIEDRHSGEVMFERDAQYFDIVFPWDAKDVPRDMLERGGTWTLKGWVRVYNSYSSFCTGESFSESARLAFRNRYPTPQSVVPDVLKILDKDWGGDIHSVPSKFHLDHCHKTGKLIDFKPAGDNLGQGLAIKSDDKVAYIVSQCRDMLVTDIDAIIGGLVELANSKERKTA